MNTEDIHKKAEHWYETSVKPIRPEILQDLLAWYKPETERFRELMINAFYVGYSKALMDNNKKE